MRVMTDAQETLLRLMDGVGGRKVTLFEAFQKTPAFAGIQERRPPTLTELIHYMIAQRAEDKPEACPYPDPSRVAPVWILRLAKDPYGMHGHGEGLRRDVWPLDSICSPFEMIEGGLIMRFWVALSMGLTQRVKWFGYRLWRPLVHVLRAAILLSIGLAVGMISEPVVGLNVIVLGSFPLMFLSPFVSAQIDVARRVVEFNHSLTIAFHRWLKSASEEDRAGLLRLG